jgi:hypothetical protein
MLYAIVGLMARLPFSIRGVMRMTRAEGPKEGKTKRMSLVLWDMFTGSAPYRDVFRRTLHPFLLSRLAWDMTVGWLAKVRSVEKQGGDDINEKHLGKLYRSGEIIVRQGDPGECMYVLQAGQAEVIQEGDGREIRLGIMGEGDFFGEMAIVDREARSATVRAFGEVRVLTVDKALFMRRVHEDPSFAFRILQKMSHRIREKDAELTHLKTQR